MINLMIWDRVYGDKCVKYMGINGHYYRWNGGYVDKGILLMVKWKIWDNGLLLIGGIGIME
jgi:hypothetical protein